MTILVGIKCEDGIVVAADRAVTFGPAAGAFTISHTACKLTVVDDKMIIAGTGHVGATQRFCETSTMVWTQLGVNAVACPPLQVARLLSSSAIADARSTHLPKPQLGALVAFPSTQGPQLCEFDLEHFQPELKDKGTWFVSMGSGQQLGDPFLAFMREVFWRDGPPTLKHGLFAAAWVLRQSIKFAPGLISEPIDIAVLQGERAEMLDEQRVKYHLDIADQATEYFRSFDPTEESVDEGGRADPMPQPVEVVTVSELSQGLQSSESKD